MPRPTLADVDRISRGQAALTRGVGSRRVPHRLNEEERRLYEVAVRRGFVVVRGTGHRRHAEAAGPPLLNTLRQRADALAQPLIWVSQVKGKCLEDSSPGGTVIDLSPLRLPSEDALQEVHARCCTVARAVVAPEMDQDEASSLLRPRAPLVPPPPHDLATRAIWALPRLELHFTDGTAEPGAKVHKRLAAALASDFGLGIG